MNEERGASLPLVEGDKVKRVVVKRVLAAVKS